MSYSEDFNSASASMAFTKDNDVQLSVVQPGIYYNATYKYNFLTRTMLYSGGIPDNKAGVALVPFSQLDPEMLQAMHAKLVELEGKPPSLPDTAGKRSLIDKGPRS